MTNHIIRRRAVGAVAVVAAATLSVGGLAQPSEAAWDPGQGYVLNNSGVQHQATYTIRFASSRIESVARPYLQSSVNELHSFARVRIAFGGVGSSTGGNEIYVSEATGGSCGGTAWGRWDGCGSYQLSSNYVNSSRLQLRYDAFSKNTSYLQALLSHELGHTLGLLHTGDTRQLMHGTVDSSDYVLNATYKSGDRAGLVYLGRNLPVPPDGGGSEQSGQVYEAGSSAGWRALAMGDTAGPIRASRTSAVLRPDGTKVLYSINDGKVFEAGSNAGWRNLYTGIEAASDLDVIMRPSGTSVVYTVRNGQVWEAGSDSWTNLYTGISGASRISAIIRPDGSTVLYTLINGQVWEAGSNAGWRNLYTGISGASDLAAVVRADGSTVLYTLINGQVWEAGSNAGWRNLYTGISGASDLDAVIRSSGASVVYTVRSGTVWEAGSDSWRNLSTGVPARTVSALQAGGEIVYAVR